MAIDLGDKRTGVAMGDDETGIVSPITTVEAARGPALIDALRTLVDSHQPAGLVVGLPLNMDGTEGPRAKLVREFGAELGAAVEKPVEFHDERLTSEAANSRMAQSGRTHAQKKKLRDALAAVVILEDWLGLR